MKTMTWIQSNKADQENKRVARIIEGGYEQDIIVIQIAMNTIVAASVKIMRFKMSE